MDSAAIVLTWYLLIMTPQGYQQGIVRDKDFKTEQRCEEFAKAYSTRMEDWARGAASLGWDIEVKVAHKCDVDTSGDPA